MSKVLLVDGNNLLMRAMHATERSNMSVDGINTGPLVVFIKSLSRHIREEQPDRVVVAWDSRHGSSYRLAIDPEYKGNRGDSGSDWEDYKHDSFEMVKTFLAMSNIFMDERPGVEADDIIAAFWNCNKYRSKVVILSSDKDFMQLLTDGTEQIRLSAGGAPTDRWTEQRVLDELGYKPSDIPKIMALTGDKGDNVPGIPGIGPKTAVKVLKEANWDLGGVTHPKIDGRQEDLLRNLSLVDLRENRTHLGVTGIPEFNPTQPGQALAGSMVSFFEMYRLTSIETEWAADRLW